MEDFPSTQHGICWESWDCLLAMKTTFLPVFLKRNVWQMCGGEGYWLRQAAWHRRWAGELQQCPWGTEPALGKTSATPLPLPAAPQRQKAAAFAGGRPARLPEGLGWQKILIFFRNTSVFGVPFVSVGFAPLWVITVTAMDSEACPFLLSTKDANTNRA